MHMSRRLGTKVENHVPDRSARASHNLYFPMRRRLPVHTAERLAARVIRDTGLHEGCVEAHLVKLTLAPCSRKLAAIIASPLQLDDKCAGERRRQENHG